MRKDNDVDGHTSSDYNEIGSKHSWPIRQDAVFDEN